MQAQPSGVSRPLARFLCVFAVASWAGHDGLAQQAAAQEASVQASQSSADVLLTDFQPVPVGAVGQQRAGVPVPREFPWVTVLDGVMGGRSSGSFVVRNGVLRFTGVLNTNGGGFSSIRTPTPGLDLTGFAGVHLRVRGDGRTYSVRMEQRGQDRSRRRRVRANYRGEFKATKLNGSAGWQDVYLPFERFVPTWRGRILDRPEIDVSRVGLLGVTLADGVDGPFAIEIDSIAAYRPLDLEAFVGQRRVLVVFAKDAADLNLLRTLRGLADASGQVEERHVSVAVVLEDGPSRLESQGASRPLGPVACAALRERFAPAEGGYTAVLVGKDGLEKFREAASIPSATWWERIDGMPMRQREMGR